MGSYECFCWCLARFIIWQGNKNKLTLDVFNLPPVLANEEADAAEVIPPPAPPAYDKNPKHIGTILLIQKWRVLMQ